MFSRCFLFFFGLSLLIDVGLTARQDFPWSVSLTVSDVAGSGYDGQVEIMTVFKDKSHKAITLPSTTYRLGQTYVFDVSLPSAGPIHGVYIRTKGVCPLGLLPTNVLRLRRVQLTSKTTNILYSKEAVDLAIKDTCQKNNSRGTAVTNFSQSTSGGYCVIEGQRYENGQRFDMGCVGRCVCENGSVACIDMCATQAWEPARKCHFVRVPGQCCDRIVCEEDAQTAKCANAAPADTIDEKGAIALRRYPWAAMYCHDDKCTQIHAGIIIGSRHLLTFAMDLSRLNHLLVSAGEYITDQLNTSRFVHMSVRNVSAHPDFVNTDSPIADSASRLQVIELDPPFSITKTLQPANLPFHPEHCSRLSAATCPLTGAGWDPTDKTEKDVRQWFFHMDQVKKSDVCDKTSATRARPAGPKRRGEKRACISGLVRQDCTGPMGGAVVATAAKTDFIIGLMDPDSSLVRCEHPGTVDMLPLCKYISWVNQVTKESY